MESDLIATLQCKDQPGIVHAVTSSILRGKGNIIENQQFTDPVTQTFVMRTRFESPESLDLASAGLHESLAEFNPDLRIRNSRSPKRALVMVTKESHCLRDLLYLLELGELPIEIPLVASNHDELQSLVESYGIAFHHLPIKGSDKSSQEKMLRELIEQHSIDFLVLARYMQILTADFCQEFSDRIINIHHSFLPGFKGARPYHQAHAKGVKIIGATAHFVTSNLDEGPIIEQDVAHVTHASSPEDLISIGRDIERRVLAKAVRLYAEDKIFIVGNRTIIF
jgi:formyltetrahydrofolate deformylase